MQGMETAYVGNVVSAENASTTVGQAVIDAVLPFDGTTQGKASIKVTQAITNNVKGDASISITTRDFVVDGTITLEDGILTWEEIDENVPKIVIKPTTLTLDTGTKYQMKATAKRTTETIHWDTSDHDIATISNTGEITTASTLKSNTAQVDVIASATGCKEKICKLTVNKVLKASSVIPVPTNSATSAYVYYTMNGQTQPTLCRVLYNDSTHGLQIITAGSVDDNVILGNNDNIGADGTDGTMEKAQNSYNNSIENLNKKAESFINIGNNIVVDARCVGSAETITKNEITNEDELGHKNDGTVDSYQQDVGQLVTLSISNINAPYWLAYREKLTNYDVKYFTSSNQNAALHNGRFKSWSTTCGFRPVFLINQTAKIKSGDGLSADTAYILEAGN